MPFSAAKDTLTHTPLGTAEGRAQFGETFTPVPLIEEMLDTLPAHLFANPDLRWFDPCAGVGNFPIVLAGRLMTGLAAAIPDPDDRLRHITTRMIAMAEIQTQSAAAIRSVFGPDATLFVGDALSAACAQALPGPFDIVLGNPPYERMVDGKRSAKNDSLWTRFIDMGFDRLREGGHLLYITPPAWMSPSSKQLRRVFLPHKILHLNIQECARHFKVGSKFSYYLLQKSPAVPGQDTRFVAHFPASSHMHAHKGSGTFQVPAGARFMPQMIAPEVFTILSKTLFCPTRPKLPVTYDSDLHRFTKKHLLAERPDSDHPYRTLHTPSQTVWASRPHKTHGRPKVLIPLTTYYERLLVDEAGVTQGFGYVLCPSLDEAHRLAAVLRTAPYRFLANITRWSNFNVPEVMRALPDIGAMDGPITDTRVADALGLNAEERAFIKRQVKPLR